MFYTEQLRFDITVPIYPLLIMLVLGVFLAWQALRERSWANALLSLFVLLWTFEIFIARDIWIYGWPIILAEQNLYKNAVYDVILAPALLIAARSFAWPDQPVWRRFDVLFAAPIVAYVYIFQLVLSLPSSQLIQFMQNRPVIAFTTFEQQLVDLLTWTPWHTWVILICALASLKNVKWQRTTNTTRLMLHVFVGYLLGYGMIQLSVLFGLLQVSWLVEGPEHLTWLTLIALAIFIYRQQISKLTLGVKTEAAKNPTVKYQSSSLDAHMAEHIFDMLRDVMDNKKVYLNDSLSLRLLAEELNVTTHQLSQTINQMADRNFFDFVNGYRIEEAQTILRDENKEHLSASFVGEQVGFKSKSAFYAAFKKHAGCTPAEYRKLNSVI